MNASALVHGLIGTAIAAAVSTSVLADGSTNFDGLTEGFHGHTVEDGNIVFFKGHEFRFDPPTVFVAEDASAYIPGVPDLVPHYSAPNVFQLSGYISGGSYLITRLAEFSFTTGLVETDARLDLFYIDDAEFEGVEMVLEAWLAGEKVAEDFATIGNPRREVRATTLEIADTPFDTLRLTARDADNPMLAGFLGSIDNLEITGGTRSPLYLELPTPGRAGVVNTLTATGGTPGERVYFAYSLRRGTSVIPGCPGARSALAGPVLLGSALTNANGEASIDVLAPAAAAERTAYFQAFERSTCTVSRFVPVTFAP